MLDLFCLRAFASAPLKHLCALCACAAIVLGSFGLGPAIASQPGGAPSVDAQLNKVFEHVQQQRLEAALEEIDRVITRYPNFRLAHLIRGDLLLARRQPISGVGAQADSVARARLEELRAEANVRLRAYAEVPHSDVFPRYLMQFDPTQKHAIVVDAGRSRVYVYKNAQGSPRLVAHYYSSIGKQGVDKSVEGDQKTPVGVYHISSHIPGAKLPDLYGWGAFPINYPNEWDRIHGKTGHGIWLHGVPSDNYARAPKASDGCVALANPDMGELAQRVQVGVTPVIIADRVEWTPATVWRAEREQFLSVIEGWRMSWESRDTDRYLAHYAQAFRSDEMDLSKWAAHKRRVNAAKTWIKVSLSNVSIFRSPGKQDLIVVTFDQDYRSSGHGEQSRKRQYWVSEQGRWKIAYEGPIKAGTLALPESFRTNRPSTWPAAVRIHKTSQNKVEISRTDEDSGRNRHARGAR